MGQLRHGSATTTHVVRAAIQRSQASLAALSRDLGIKREQVSSRTAAAAKAAASIAIESVVTDEPWDGSCSDPVTRRARLAYAAWFVLLAGIDEEGIDRDLDCAAELFYAAAMA